MSDNGNSSELKDLKMCQLKAKGLMEEIDRRSSKPTVVCNKCGAKANQADQVHNPLPLKKCSGDSLWG